MVSEEQAIREFANYVATNDSNYAHWYVGIASDPVDRLFNQHGVHHDGDAWGHEPLASSDAARQVEDHFLQRGMDGGGGGGDESSTHVYIYRKNDHTDP